MWCIPRHGTKVESTFQNKRNPRFAGTFKAFCSLPSDVNQSSPFLTPMEHYGTNVIGERHVAAVPDDQNDRSPEFCVCELGKRESNRKSKVPLLNNKDGFQKRTSRFTQRLNTLLFPFLSRADALDATVDLPDYTVQ